REKLHTMSLMCSIEAGGAPEQLTSTRWSIVLAAGKRSSPESQQAMAELCNRYWYPLYAHARRQTRDVHEAQDLAQGFFATVLEKNYLATVTPQRGRFRAFLLTAFKHYMANEWDKNRAKKRGGSICKVALDFMSADRRYRLEPADHLT